MKTRKQRRHRAKQRLARWIRDGRQPRKLIYGFSFELLQQFPEWEAPK